MEGFNNLIDEVVNICESNGVPILIAYGTDKINVVDFQPQDTPDRIRKVFAGLMQGVKQTKRKTEIQA